MEHVWIVVSRLYEEFKEAFLTRSAARHYVADLVTTQGHLRRWYTIRKVEVKK